MIETLVRAVAGSGKPAFLAKLVPGVLVSALSPAPLHTQDGIIVATVTFENPWKAPITVRAIRISHVTMGDMPSVEAPALIKALPGPAWLEPAGVDLQPGQKASGRMAFSCRKLTVSIPSAVEAQPSIGGIGRGGVLCVPVEDLEKEAQKAAEKAAKAAKPA